MPVEPGENLVDKVKQWADDVLSDLKKEEALKLSQSFMSIASMIEQGTFSTPVELVSATKISNGSALGDNISKWIPFLNSLMQELQAMNKIGKLPDMQSHASVWREIARGLEEYTTTLE